jgi:hypothetical protein
MEADKTFAYNPDTILTVIGESNVIDIDRISEYGKIIQIAINVLTFVRNMKSKINRIQPTQTANVSK